MTRVQISLPTTLAREAAVAGLLEPARIERLLRDELQGVRLERPAAVRARLLADPMPPMSPPMSPADIQAEIDAYRRGASGAPGT